MRGNTARVARYGILLAFALALSYLESLLIAGLPGLPPGVKPGLSNVIVMQTLLSDGFFPAALLGCLKALFAFVTRGATAGLLSLCGGIVSILFMTAALRLFRASVPFSAVCGAIGHNFGQLAAAALLIGTPEVWLYAPILILSGIAVGLLTGFTAEALLKALGTQPIKETK